MWTSYQTIYCFRWRQNEIVYRASRDTNNVYHVMLSWQRCVDTAINNHFQGKCQRGKTYIFFFASLERISCNITHFPHLDTWYCIRVTNNCCHNSFKFFPNCNFIFLPDFQIQNCGAHFQWTERPEECRILVLIL